MRPELRRFVYRSALLTLAIAACGEDSNPTTEPRVAKSFTTPTGLVTANPPEIFAGAGDMADCGRTFDEETALLLDNIPGTVFALGDNVYENGTATEYRNCYTPNWGRHKARTKPVPGNHDYNTNGASGYYGYFGAAAGDPAKGYYSFELGAWHVIALNSNIPMSVGSPQQQWLTADLASHSNLCTLAYWHHPLYSSTEGTGTGGITYGGVRPLWDALYAAKADLVLGGHRHFYERLAPIKPDGTRDDVSGVREIIAGTGGKSGGTVTNRFPTSEVRNGDTYGVLKLYLYDDSYAWKFIPIAGQTFTDSGSTACHGPGGPPPGGGVSASLSTVSAAPTTIPASSGASTTTITVTAKDENGNPVSGATVVLSATGSGNTLTQPAAPTGSDGGATGSLSSTAAASKTVSATINGLAITQTASVTVEPGPATQLAFTVQPARTAPGAIITPAVEVEVRDQFANRVASATTITLAIGTNPGGGTLSGTTTVTAAGGVARFTDLSIDQAGTGYTLAASAAGLNGATSQPFDISVSVATITHTLLTAGQKVNAVVFTTGPIAPRGNTLVTVAVMAQQSQGVAPSPTVSGGGMSAWTEVASVTFDPLSLPTRRLTIYRAMSAAPGSGPLTITFSGTQFSSQWIVSQWDSVDTGGVNGAGAIVQTGLSRGDAVSGLTVPLLAFQSSHNVAYGVFGVRSGRAAITPGAGFTEISEQFSGKKRPGDLQAERAVNLRNIAATWTGLNGAALGVEIKAR